jgi:class 3 adenylate cyclase
MTTTRRFAAILAADVVGYARLMGAFSAGPHAEPATVLARHDFDKGVRHLARMSWCRRRSRCQT